MSSGAKRVLVTRAPHQASELAERLRALGLEPVLVPTIEIAEPQSFASLDRGLAEMARFDWLVFTSANAVEAFARRAEVLAVGRVRVAAIGRATGKAAAAVLERLGWVGEVAVPTVAVAESLAELLLPFARREDGSPGRFLLVRAEVAREHLPEALAAAGAEVVLADAYRTVIPVGSVASVRELFGGVGPVPDAVAFTSSSSVVNLLALLVEAEVSLPRSVRRASIGPVTSRTMVEHGLPPDVEAEEASVEALALATARMLGLQSMP